MEQASRDSKANFKVELKHFLGTYIKKPKKRRKNKNKNKQTLSELYYSSSYLKVAVIKRCDTNSNAHAIFCVKIYIM